jgi:hypothetical protein
MEIADVARSTSVKSINRAKVATKTGVETKTQRFVVSSMPVFRPRRPSASVTVRI